MNLNRYKFYHKAIRNFFVTNVIDRVGIGIYNVDNKKGVMQTKIRGAIILKTIKIVVFICLLFSLLNPMNLFAGSTPITKDYKLTLKAENLTLTDVAKLLNELGIVIYIDRAEKDRIINFDFKDTPFEKAIKMLAYPLNYVIFFDEGGGVKELRIFNTNISPTKGYLVFHAKIDETDNNKELKMTGSTNTVVRDTDSQTQKIIDTQKDKKKNINDDSERFGTNPFVLSSIPLNGEAAYNYNVWLNKRLVEMNYIAEQKKMYFEKELEASKITTMNQNMNLMANLNNQQILGAMTNQQNNNIEAFYSYANETSKILEAKRTQEIINTQMKNLASYTYYQQKSQGGPQANPYTANQSYYYNMSVIKSLYGKK